MSEKGKPAGQQKCPHCGGMHFGQRFDNCPFERNCPWCGAGTWNGKLCLTCGAKGPNGQ